MDEREQDRAEESERHRPRVVDKRVSARPGPADAGRGGTGGAAGEPPEVGPGSAAPPRPAQPAAERAGSGPIPVPPASAPERPAPSPEPPPEPPPAAPGGAGQVWTPEQEEQARRIAEELARAPARDLVVTFAMNFVEVASVKLESGDLPGAQLAIDAFEGVLKGLGAKLGETESAMRTVLAELQMAYAQRAMRPPPPGS